MKRIAIIGSSGMVGSDLAQHLSPQFDVTGITRENYHHFKGRTFDVLINANGNSKRFWANEHVLEDFALSTISVYTTLFDFFYKLYVYISSSDVYENHWNPRFTNETRKIHPENLSPYGFHKYLSELIVRNHTKDYVILRSSMILGKNLAKGPIYDILQNKRLFISPASKLQMITTEEFANVVYFLIRRHITREVFNVGGKGTVSFKAIHRYIRKPITFPQDGERQIYEMSVAKLHRIYPFKTSEEYLRDFLQHMNKRL